jgi:hypothetical protein
MYYKKEEDGCWNVGNRIDFPDGTTLNSENKLSKDGWEWYDEPPQEYLDWLDIQNQDNYI